MYFFLFNYFSVTSIHECIVLDCFRLQTVVWDCNNNVALLLLLLWDEEAQAGYLQTVFLCAQTAQTLIICGHTQDTILKKHRCILTCHHIMVILSKLKTRYV